MRFTLRRLNLPREVGNNPFQTIPKDVLQWFPGHMGKGLKQMQQKLRQVDCIIEVHDARIPFSGRNTDFQRTLFGIKPHILVLNKSDLIPRKFQSKIADKYKTEHNIDHVIYTNCKSGQDPGVKQLLPLSRDLIVASPRFNRADETDHCMMIIGVPNVGKSSLINAMRNRFLHRANATAVGAVAGITRSVLHKIKIHETPLIYLIDTPGIVTPQVSDTETGLRLALCSCLQDHLVGEELIAAYLLYWLNKHKNFTYVKCMGLDAATDDINLVLTQCALKMGKVSRVKSTLGGYEVKPNLQHAAIFMIKAFRSGEMGKICLDDNLF